MSRGCRQFFLFLVMLLTANSLAAQNQMDSVLRQEGDIIANANSNVEEITTDSLGDKPNRAAMYSAVFPGLGQAYNKKYWKLPIIYGGSAVLVYFLNYNNKMYQESGNSLIAIRDDDPRTQPFDPDISETSYERATDYWRRNRDLLIIGAIVLYALNIVEAHVDAHLSGFTIQENLSMKIRPAWNKTVTNSNLIGLSVIIKI